MGPAEVGLGCPEIRTVWNCSSSLSQRRFSAVSDMGGLPLRRLSQGASSQGSESSADSSALSAEVSALSATISYLRSLGIHRNAEQGSRKCPRPFTALYTAGETIP